MHTEDQLNPLPQSEETTTEFSQPEAIAEATAVENAESEVSPFEAFRESDPGLEPSVPAEAAAEGEEAPAQPEPIAYRELSPEELESAVEAVLFMNHKPVTIAKLREWIHPEISEEDYRTAISNLMASYFDENRGIELVEVANAFQLRTKAHNKDIVRRMYQISPMKLTNAMLEVLAIVAYNQPITREGIDKIRGVDSSHLVRVLLDKKMLRIAGKSDEIGKPMLYATSKEFLELFGLRDLGQLPTLRDIEEMLPKNEVGAEISEEELLAKEMEGIVAESKPLEFLDLEMEDLEAHEEKKNEESLSSRADGDGRPALDGAAEARGEAAGALDLEAETLGRLPIGPEGNA